MACLIIKNDGIGDLVLASGLLADLVGHFGEVDLITCQQNREIAASIPGLRHRLEVSRDAIRFRRWPAKLGLHLVKSEPPDRDVFEWLSTQRYDTAICLRRFIRQSSLILMSKVQANRRFCAWMYPTNTDESLASHLSRGWQHFKPQGAPRSELDYYRTFLRESLGIQSASTPRLSCTADVRTTPQAHRIGLCLSGNSTNWPQANWRTLALELHKLGKQLVLFGGKDANGLAGEIASLCLGAEDFTGKLTFASSVPHLAALELLIGNDTGFTHFATLATQRLMVIMGGGTFGRFFPWPEAERQFIIFHSLDCYDCGWQCKYPAPECLNRVPPSAVSAYAQAILAGSAPRQLNLNHATVKFLSGWRYVRGATEGVAILRQPTAES